MDPERTSSVSFPVGYHRFHKDQLFNYQLNRPYSLGYARIEDLREAGRRISTFAEWKTEMLRLAAEARAAGRLVNSAFYYRAAEFYTFPDDPDKQPLYDRFSETFYRAFADHGIERLEVPYGGTHLPAIAIRPEGKPRGHIVLHGGYDSFIEEFYSLMLYFAAAGYRVIGFDGPGQGAARRKAGLPLDFRWEKPVGAVLDRLGLDDVTLIGLSMGGYFALRAAALEPRVKRVIASGHAFDYRRVARAPATAILVFFHDHFRELTNRLSLWKIRKGGMESWNISHLMYVLGVDEPMAALEFALQLNEENLHSDLVRQHVLVLASGEDHFIPFRLHREQLRRLTAAGSVTDRVFTREDHAENHCQIGNIGLALSVMREWIDERIGE
ncbi:MAG: alpha/beta fold hydrolase [Acidobacteriota bacterium]